MRRFLLLIAFAFFISPLVFSQVEGSRRYVAMSNAVLKDSTGFLAKELEILTFGDEVMMLREDGKWSQVRTRNQTGWLPTTSLSARRILMSGASATATELSLAGKGFSQEIEIEYRRNGLNYSVVDSMENINILMDELQRFIAEGRLASGQ